MKLCKGILLLIVAVMLFGCGKTPATMTPEKLIQEATVVFRSITINTCRRKRCGESLIKQKFKRILARRRQSMT